MTRIVRRELDQTVHREIVTPIRLNGVTVDERALRSVVTFVALYVVLFGLGALARHRPEACGGRSRLVRRDRSGRVLPWQCRPCLRIRRPFGSYAQFSDLSTGILVGLMWLGRLEIIPIAVLLTRNYWRP